MINIEQVKTEFLALAQKKQAKLDKKVGKSKREYWETQPEPMDSVNVAFKLKDMLCTDKDLLEKIKPVFEALMENWLYKAMKKVRGDELRKKHEIKRMVVNAKVESVNCNGVETCG